MAVEDRIDERTESMSSPAIDDRTVSLSAYVDLPIAQVFARFADPSIDGLLATAIRAALGSDAELMSVHAAPTLWVSSGNVRVPVMWRMRGSSGATMEGTATISLLVVQSGHDAITELLVSLPVSDDGMATAIAAAAHRVLDELTRRLEAVGPTSQRQ